MTLLRVGDSLMLTIESNPVAMSVTLTPEQVREMGQALIEGASVFRCYAPRRPSLAERRVALGLSSPSAAERRETLAKNLDDLANEGNS